MQKNQIFIYRIAIFIYYLLTSSDKSFLLFKYSLWVKSFNCPAQLVPFDGRIKLELMTYKVLPGEDFIWSLASQQSLIKV
jgi:hypothetical protein